MVEDNKNELPKRILTPPVTPQPSGTEAGRRTTFVPITGNSSLASLDSNFVFFFGKAQVGKSVILAAMLYYMNAKAGSIKPKASTPNSQEAERLLYDFLNELKRGQLPSRTTKDLVTRIDMVFEPNNTSKKVRPVSLTFLEMSGENHSEVQRGGSYHRSIEEYLRTDIPLSFIMVTDYDNAAEDDALMFSFLNELQKKGRNLKYINAILVVSKWDKSGHREVFSEDQLDDFISEHMPMTANTINNHALSKTYFTIGELGSGADGDERLNELDLATAGALTEWLYKSITGVDLNYAGTFWERLKGR